MMRGRAAVSLLALALALAPGAAATEPATVHLEYLREPGTSSCVSFEQLSRDVEARLARQVFVTPARAELGARVRARRVARRFVVEIELFDRAQHSLGRRELSTGAAHCSALDDSLALVLALAADMPREPATNMPGGATGSASAPPSIARARSLETPLSIPDSTVPPRLGPRLRPSLGGTLALGLIPSLAPGLELGLELRFGHFWPIALRAAGFAEQRRAATAPSKSATFTAQTLELSVCPWAGALGRLEASVCVAQCIGRVRARGVGFDQEQRDDGWLLNAGAGFGLSQTFGPLFVGASGTLLVPVVRRRYFFTDDADITLYEQPWLGALVGLRVGTEI